MSWIKRFLRKFKRRQYDAATKGHLSYWKANKYDPNAELSNNLDVIRARARDVVRNNPWGRRIVYALSNAIVSTGLRPTVTLGDSADSKALEARVYDLWEQWSKVAVSGCNIDIYGLQHLLCRAWITDGEALARVRFRYQEDMPGLPPVQLQPIESDLLPIDTTYTIPNGGYVIHGVEFSPIGQVVAYHLFRQHPGSTLNLLPSLETVRVDASEMIHLFLHDRPGQVRGVSLLAPVIVGLWDLAGYTESIRVATRAAATIVGTVTGGDEYSPPDGLANEWTAQGYVTDAAGNPIESLTPGMVLYAPIGKEIKIHSPQPPSGIKDFISAMLHEIAAGVGLSYHVLSGDMSDSSFAQAKLGLIEQSKHIEVLRRHIFVPLVCDPIWKAFVDAAILAGLLPATEELYDVRWSSPQQQSADRLDEAKAAMLEMRLGLRSRQEIIEATGRDPDVVNAEIAADMEARKRLGIVIDGDPSQTTTAGVKQADTIDKGKKGK